MDFPFEFQALPSVHSIELFFATVPAGGLEILEGSLSPSELERADRFRSARDRQRLVFRRAFLRSLIADRLQLDPREVEFSLLPLGKPYLAGTRLQFSISHSHNAVLIALAGDREVGIDLQRADPAFDYLPMVRDYFTTQEAATVVTVVDFCRLWVKKESIVKAIGIGLSEDLRKIDTALQPLPLNDQWIYHQPMEVGDHYFASVAWTSESADR